MVFILSYLFLYEFYWLFLGKTPPLKNVFAGLIITIKITTHNDNFFPENLINNALP